MAAGLHCDSEKNDEDSVTVASSRSSTTTTKPASAPGIVPQRKKKTMTKWFRILLKKTEESDTAMSPTPVSQSTYIFNIIERVAKEDPSEDPNEDDKKIPKRDVSDLIYAGVLFLHSPSDADRLVGALLLRGALTMVNLKYRDNDEIMEELKHVKIHAIDSMGKFAKRAFVNGLIQRHTDTHRPEADPIDQQQPTQQGSLMNCVVQSATNPPCQSLLRCVRKCGDVYDAIAGLFPPPKSPELAEFSFEAKRTIEARLAGGAPQIDGVDDDETQQSDHIRDVAPVAPGEGSPRQRHNNDPSNERQTTIAASLQDVPMEDVDDESEDETGSALQDTSEEGQNAVEVDVYGSVVEDSHGQGIVVDFVDNDETATEDSANAEA